MVFLFLVGCSALLDDDPFSGGSDRYDQPDWSSSDTADTAGDTGDTAGGGDAGAPVLTDIDLTWEEYPNIGNVLQFVAKYTDEGDDIVGGMCFIDVYNGDEAAGSFELEVSDDPDGEGVCVAVSGSLIFAIEDLDDGKSGGVSVEVMDGSRNVSATYEASTEE